MLEGVILEGYNFGSFYKAFKDNVGVVSDAIDNGAVVKVAKFLESNPQLASLGKELLNEAIKDGTGIDALALATTLSSLSNFSAKIQGTPGAGGAGGGIAVTDSPNNIGDKFGTFRTSLLTDPIEIRIVSKINANWYGSFYPRSIPTDFSTLHVNTARFTLNSYLNDGLHAPDVFMNTVIVPQFLYAMQRKLKYNLPTTVTISRLRSYFDELIKCLNNFYFFGSLFGYTNSSTNRHDSMTFLASKLTPADKQAYLSLKWKLSGEAIPPNLKMLSAWLYQTYASSSVPGSSLLKFCPANLVSDNPPLGYYPSTADLLACVNRLNQYTDISSHMCTAFGEWIDSELKDSCPNILHDETFTAVWMNSPLLVTTAGGTVHQFRTSGPDVPYSMPGTNVDPIAYSLATTVGPDNKQYSGLLAPHSQLSLFDNNSHNQWSYSNHDGNLGLVTTASSTGINYSAPRTFSETGLTNHVSNVVAFCEPYFGINYTAVTESCYSLIEWLFSFEDMKSPVPTPNQKFGSGRIKGEDKTRRGR